MPDLLTVEEAARFLRVGRTKAYAMTREWRATSGRSGLPVVDFGNVLRVPRRALEELIGVDLSATVEGSKRAVGLDNGVVAEADDQPRRPETTRSASCEPPPAITRPARRSRRPPATPRLTQLDLFDSTAPVASI